MKPLIGFARDAGLVLGSCISIGYVAFQWHSFVAENDRRALTEELRAASCTERNGVLRNGVCVIHPGRGGQ